MTKKWINAAATLLLAGPLLAGCGDRKSEQGVSQRPPDQSQPPAPPAPPVLGQGQSGSQDPSKAPELAPVQPEEKKEGRTAGEQKPGDRG